MGKKLLAVTKAAAVGTGVAAGAGFIFFTEVINRRAKLSQLLGPVLCKETAFDQNVPDEREIWSKEQKFEEFTITNVLGQKLRGYLLKADEPSDVYVFGAHGYRGSGKEEFRFMMKYYHEKGYNVFIVDHQAAGESEGKYIGFGYHESRDCMLWLEHMKELFGEDIQIILHGVSMGSATVMLMSGDEDLPENVKFIVSDCGYTSAWNEMAHNFKTVHVPTFPVLNCANAFSKLIAGYDFRDADPVNAVKKATRPMIFIHGANDDFVPTYMVNEVYGACASQDKKLMIVEGAGHAESYRMNSEGYEALINEFAEKYIK